ncbi:hypothetical protein BGZ68_001337 [Mortierella alpina]|nr:hypothetical protein BGZ68_001337 [Mortierella alpina]
MPSTGSPALSARPEAAETDLDPSSQPTFDHLITDFSKALMPCPKKPMDPHFGPGPVCEPQHGKTDGSKLIQATLALALTFRKAITLITIYPQHSGFLSVFYSLGSDPLQMWAKRVGKPPASASKPKPATSTGDSSSPSASQQTPAQEPHVEFLIDDTLNSQVLELLSTNLASTFITTPSLATRTLGIKLPFLVFLVKNLGKYWSFEVTVLDDLGEKRRFRASNFQNATRVKPFITTMPLRMDPGWNQIQLNLADYTKRAYGTTFVETLRITIHANCRIRRIYFSDRLVPENELPAEFKLYLPVVK